MADQVSQRMVVNASPEVCLDVVTDFDAYLNWAPDLKEVKVLGRDDQGRAASVQFRAAGIGRSNHYTLDYDYSKAPNEVSWIQSSGDLTTRLDGAYAFEPTGEGTTEVTYKLLVELRIPLPAFVKRRAESKIISTALRSLKARAESKAKAGSS
ncbi:MAG TPA: SRPBCC family protein [Acidimicrobiales bacterium]|nr:SRPBCC family protein [Acidimicrobiales bacterium]